MSSYAKAYRRIGVVDRLDSQSAAPAQLARQSYKCMCNNSVRSKYPQASPYVRWSVLEVQLPIGIKGESGSGLRSKLPCMCARFTYVRATYGNAYARIYTHTHTHTRAHTHTHTHTHTYLTIHPHYKPSPILTCFYPRVRRAEPAASFVI